MEELGVAQEATLISTDKLVRAYQDKMAAVEKESVVALQELFLERSELFLQGDSAQTLERATKELEVGHWGRECWGGGFPPGAKPIA